MANLPEIKITHHAGATRLRLRVDSNQIRLTVPKLCSQRQIRDFLRQSEAWMIETWHKQQEKIQQVDQSLPSTLQLFNLKQPLAIIYKTQKNSYLLDEENHQLFISDRQPIDYLKAFVLAYAKHYLPRYLKQISDETHLKFGQCTVRQAKTRWGSCTSKHDIMLNSGLVLCAEAVARYVCIHELAHTQHFNHSAAFWSEVAQHDQTYQQHRQTLKNTQMPWWWLASK